MPSLQVVGSLPDAGAALPARSGSLKVPGGLKIARRAQDLICTDNDEEKTAVPRYCCVIAAPRYSLFFQARQAKKAKES